MSHIESVYILMFVSGLLGSIGHCIGMCGPVVAACSLHIRRGHIFPHLLYNLGRIATYSTIGGIMGLTGSFVGVAGSIEKFQNMAMAVIGLAMVLMGVSMLGYLPGLKKLEAKNPLSHLVIRFVKLFPRDGGAGVYFPLGLLMGFIPCGLLYTAFVAAAGAGVDAPDQASGLLRGLLMLFLFGVGTMPALLVLGSAVSITGERLRGWFYRASALAMMLAGVVFVWRALRL
ncbi:MAG: sulfite exporter TauE/SafE family protein [Syntrophales bacterium]|nr:sulfite exporter TauE/SafE family protein [Syntrophales bacterium]